MNSDYIVAIHGMVCLLHSGETVSSEVLAENICTNPARVRRVMSRLKKAGLVETHEGRRDGGYSYKTGKFVTLGDIGRALDISFADFSWHSGDKNCPCPISSGMPGYIDGLSANLDNRCLAYLDTITVGDAERSLFKNLY